MPRINERLAVWLTKHLGSMAFTWGSVLAFALWMGWNTLGPRGWRFDTPPWFPVLLFILNVGQWLFIGITLVGQNVLSRQNETRAAHEFEIVQKLDLLLEHVHADVDRLQTEMAALEAPGKGRPGHALDDNA